MNRAALEQRVEQYHRAERELDARLMREADASSISSDLVAAAMNGRSLDAAMSKLPNVEQSRTLISSINRCRSDRMDALQKLAHLAGDVHLEQATIRDSDADALQKQVDAHLAEIEKLDGVKYGAIPYVERITTHKGQRYGNLVGQGPGKIQKLRDEAAALRRQAAEAERAPVLGSGSITVQLRDFQADPLAPEYWEQIEAELYRDPMQMQPAAYEIRARLSGDTLRRQFRESGSSGDTSAPFELRIVWRDSRLIEVSLMPAAAVHVA